MRSARPVSRRRWGAALLAATCLSPAGVAAQIWNGTTSSDFQVSSNWSPAIVPSGTGATATFVNNKGVTSVTNASGTIGGLLFNDSNTPSYTIDLGFQGLTLASTGIVNNSSVLQTITGGGTSGILQINAGTLFNVNLAMTSSNIIFAGTASAGNASITNISNVNMNNSSTLANATVTKNGGALNFLNTSSGGQASVILNGSGRLQFANYTGAGTTIGSLAGSGTVNLTDISNAQTKSLTIGGNNQSTTFSGQIVGGGSIVKAGSGTLILTGDNTYSGGTTINTGTLQIGNGGATGSVPGNIVNNAALAFNRSDDVTYGGVISGTGSLTQAGSGQLTLTGTNTFTGGTTVNAGRLAVNGSLASGVTVLGGGNLGGTGTIGGNVTVGGAISPGNSIGTINITGNYTQNAGSTYQVEVGSQSDLINITGNATINGGTVAVQGVAGARQTTYTIVTAAGGVTGTYSGLTSNFAFVTPSLSYNAQNVFLTLQTSFAGGAQTGNEREVGGALDKIKDAASGDLDTVVTVLANLDRQRGPSLLDVISGQPYADFGTMNVNNGALFMNALAQQMAMARGGAGGGQRQALAQACDVAACEGPGPWSAWGSALGGLGSVLGDGNTSTLNYNFGGAAVGVDYRFDPRFLVGIGVGYTHGTEWVNGFPGQAWSDSVSVAAYGSFTHGAMGRLLRRCAGRLRLLQQPAAAADVDPRPAAAHRHRQHRRQPVPGPGRDRLQARHLCAGVGHPHALRPAAGEQRDAKRLHRGGRPVAQPERGATDHQLAAHGAGRGPRRGDRAGQRAEARPGAAAGLDARVRLHRPADHGGFLRRTLGRFHRLRRHAAARQRPRQLDGQRRRHRRHPGLPALRRHGRRRHRQPHAECRRALLLVRRPPTRRP